MFAKERDMLAINPALCAEVAFASTKRLEGAGNLAGSVVTLLNGLDATAAGLTPGQIMIVAGVAMEIVAVPSATQVRVSRLRGRESDAEIPPGIASGPVVVTSPGYGPALVAGHRRLLGLFGLAEGEGSERVLGAARVKNGSELTRLEALLALVELYAAAAGDAQPGWWGGGAGGAGGAGGGGGGGVGGLLASKAALWRREADRERQRVAALVDADGDGVADSTRSAMARRPRRG